MRLLTWGLIFGLPLGLAQAAGAGEMRLGNGVPGATFRNAVGIVQVNQAAGSRNDSANTFALSLSAGAGP